MSHKLSQKKPFLAAARNGDLNTVGRLLDEGTPVDVFSGNKSTALIRAAGEGHEQIVQLLLDRGADVQVSNQVRETALTRAAAHGHLSVAAVLLDAGCGVNGNCHHSLGCNTPLEWALLNGHSEVASLLRKRGADPNLAMGMITYRQRLDLVDILLEMGADVNEGTCRGYTPLMRSATGGHLEMVLALIARGADLNRRSQSDSTALGQALRLAHTFVAEALVQNGARCQFLNEAIGLKDTEAVKSLLEAGADPNDTRPFESHPNAKEKPLFYAVAEQNVELVTLLLNYRANPNFQTPYRTSSPYPKSLMDFAYERENPEIVNALLEAGAVYSLKRGP
jgi:ankyrin repeat protein